MANANFRFLSMGLRNGDVGWLPPSNGSDDTAAINVALASVEMVRGLPGETYRISAPLKIMLSNSALDMTGCTVSLNSGSNCNMLTNGTAGRLTDVTVRGGTWARGGNAGSGSNLHSLFLRKFDRLTVTDLRVTSSAGKYALAIGDATEVKVRGLSFASFSDGVHITGPASQVDIRNITGTTGDDHVALTARDWPAYDDVRGDITGVTIDGVYANGSLAAIKATANNTQKIQGLSVKNVFGTTSIRPIALIFDPGSGSDAVGPATINGVTVCDIDVQGGTSSQLVTLRGSSSTDMSFRNVRLRYAPTSPIFLADQNTLIGALNIDDFEIASGVTSSANLVGAAGTARIGVLRVSRFRYPSTWSGSAVSVGGSAVVDNQSNTDAVQLPF